MKHLPGRASPPNILANGLAGVTVWERPSGAAFWGVVALAVLFAVLFGLRVTLRMLAQQRKEHEKAEKRRGD